MFKRQLFLSLTALGVLGGFFVLQAVAVSPISIISPVEGEYINGVKEIQWTTAENVCTEDNYVNIQYSTGGNYSTFATVKCLLGNFDWDTTEYIDNSNYQIRIFLDGNLGTNGLSKTFTIDNTLPVVDSAALTSLNSNELLLGGSTKAITWDSSKITELNQGDNVIVLDYATDGTTWIPIVATSNSGSYNWLVPNSVTSNSVQVRLTAQDKAGNVSTTSDVSEKFIIDSQKPVGAISLDKASVNDSDNIRTITVTYNELMDTDVYPVIRFVDVTYTAEEGNCWIDDQTWEQDFTFSDNLQNFSTNIGVTGAKDVAGNEQAESIALSALAIDTQNPTVKNVNVTPSLAKAGNLDIEVEFSEAMNISSNPTVEILAGTIPDEVAYTVSGSFSDSDTWTGSYVLPSNAPNGSAKIKVSGVRDMATNLMLFDYEKLDAFIIDTQNPTVSSISIDNNALGGNNRKMKITVDYNEKMDKSSTPSIVFSNVLDVGTWTAGSESWTNDDTWTGEFTVSDEDKAADSLYFTVNRAKDVAGNTQDALVSSSKGVYFAIDTQNPTVGLSDDHNDAIVSGADNFIITATFSEAVANPTIKIGDASAVVMTIGLDAKTWTYLWDVPNDINKNVDVVIAAKDSFGNDNVAATGTISYTVDNTKPAVAINALTTKNTTPTITGTVDDADATVKINIGGAEYTATVDKTAKTWTATVVTALLSGTYDVVATATDVAGNSDTDNTSGELIIDVTAPSITNFTAPVAKTVYRNGVALAFTATDAATAVACSYKVDGAGDDIAVPCISGVPVSTTISGLSDGTHTITLKVTDAAGNSFGAVSASFIVDTDKILTVGASGADFTKIQDAVNAAQPGSGSIDGDTVSVAAGTYLENIYIGGGKSKVKILGHSKDDTFIKISAKEAFYINSAVTISGFTIDCQGTGEYGIYSSSTTNIVVENNIIKNYKKNGVFVSGVSMEIKNNKITGTGLQTDFSADAIYTFNGATVTITGNELSNNKFEPLSGGTSAGISIHAGDRVIATGNTIYGNTVGIHAKSGATVDANENKIYTNDVNFYFEDDNQALTESFEVVDNWWGTPRKSDIANGISAGVGFTPWYLDEAMTKLSSTDTTGPVVELSTSDADGIVGSGDTITISADISDETTDIDTGIIPQLKITNGQAIDGVFSDLTVTLVFNTETGKWTYDWQVPAGNATATFTVTAFDYVGNGVSETTGTKSLIIDNAGPVLVATALVTTPTNDNTPEYKFTSDEAGTVAYSAGCAGPLQNAVKGENVVVFNALADGLYNSCVITVTDFVGNKSDLAVSAFTIDTVAPVTTAAPSKTLSNNDVTVTLFATDERTEVDKTYYCVDSEDKCNPAIEYAPAGVTVSATGENFVRFYSKDKAGNNETAKSVKVTIDKQGPTIEITSPLSGNKINGDEAIVFTDNELTAPRCSFDNLSWTSCTSGSTKLSDISGFAGLSEVAFTLYVQDTDSAGNTGSDSEAGIIKDISAPTITGITSGVADGSYNAGEVIDINVAFSEAVTGNVQVTVNTGKTCSFAISNSNHGTCDYTVVAGDNSGDLDAILSGSIADEAGNLVTVFTPSLATTRNIVVDTQKPVIAAHINETAEATGSDGAKVDYILPTVTDNLDTNITAVCELASGNKFALGETTVTCNASDDAGNAADPITFKVNVQDKTAPTIATLSDITLEATSPAGAVATYVKPAATDAVDASVDVACSLASGSTFAIGTTAVICTATDDSQNSATSSFNVIVRDTIAPKIVGITPEDKAVTSTGTPTISAQFEEAGSGIDKSSIVLSVAEYPDADYLAEKTTAGVSFTPKTPFENGTYHVNVSVKDKAGNSAAVSWIFIINKAVPSISLTSDKTSLPADGTSSAIITATALKNGLPVEGAMVNFATTIGTISDITNTNANGQATATITSTTPGETTITATYNPGDGVVQATYKINFTEVIKDTTPPIATSVPVDGATGVSVDVKPVITFSEEVILKADIQLRKYSDDSIIPVSLEYDTINGKTTIVTIKPTDELEFATQYYLYILSNSTKDVAGNSFASWTSTDGNKSSHEFTTASEVLPVTEFNISLKKGWNLISLPIIPENKSISTVLGGLTEGSLDIVQYYDAETESWLAYKPGIGGNLSKLEDGKGYWVYMNSDQVLTITGSEWPAGGITVPLSYAVAGKKWNLIGFKSATSMTAGEYISQMGEKDIIWVYKDGKYTSMTKAGLMEPGLGYWFYTIEEDGFDIIPKQN